MCADESLLVPHSRSLVYTAAASFRTPDNSIANAGMGVDELPRGARIPRDNRRCETVEDCTPQTRVVCG